MGLMPTLSGMDLHGPAENKDGCLHYRLMARKLSIQEVEPLTDLEKYLLPNCNLHEKLPLCFGPGSRL